MRRQTGPPSCRGPKRAYARVGYVFEIRRPPPDRDDIARFLVASDLRLADDAAAALAGAMWAVELDRGEFLCLQGEPSDRFFVVYSGELAVQASSRDGRELVFTTLGPGAPIGEVSVFDAVPRTAAIRAERPSRVLAVGRDTVLDLMTAHPSLTVGLARHLATIVRRLSGSVEGVSFLPLRARLAALVLSLAEERPASRGETRVEVVATQQALADRLGSSRESVNKLLGRWADDGQVVVRRGRVELLDVTALRAMSTSTDPGKTVEV